MVFDENGKYDEERLRIDFDRYNRKRRDEFLEKNEWYKEYDDDW